MPNVQLEWAFLEAMVCLASGGYASTCREVDMSSNNHWAIVLAGGEGTRIQPLIERCLGFACPKQYFTFCGKHSMLENTIDRAARLVGADRVITVTGSWHRRYLATQRLQGHLLEQPSSRGTGAGIFLPAAHILARDPDATVLVFPSDHFLCPRAKFLEQVALALRFADRFIERLILMAAVPDLPETDYGWVEAGEHLPGFDPKDLLPVREVVSFREKPGSDEANSCFRQGHLWNTMILAVKLKALWNLGKRFLPDVLAKFEAFHRNLLGKRARRIGQEDSDLIGLYESIPAFDFSSALLSQSSGCCAVMPLQGVLWSDWGRPERVFETLQRIGRKPHFLDAARRWRRNRRLSTALRSPVLA